MGAWRWNDFSCSLPVAHAGSNRQPFSFHALPEPDDSELASVASAFHAVATQAAAEDHLRAVLQLRVAPLAARLEKRQGRRQLSAAAAPFIPARALAAAANLSSGAAGVGGVTGSFAASGGASAVTAAEADADADEALLLQGRGDDHDELEGDDGWEPARMGRRKPRGGRRRRR
jgi:hypothetical protein